jgi:RND family efflux transporter MFP subunit
MATIATQRKRTRMNRTWIIGIVVVVIVLAAIAAFVMSRSATSTAATETPGWTTATANTGTIDAAVSATGSVEAQAQAELRFAAEGIVTEILVKPGQQVQAGQALARLDATDLQLKVEQVQADLKQSQADYQQLKDKASPQEISAAQARVAQAKGQYQQTAGSVTRADIAAAQAQLNAAQAKLASLLAGHTSASDAELSLQSAQNQLAAKRDQLSLEKANAQNALQQRVNDLTKVQAAYSTALQSWQYVKDTGRDPITPSTTDAKGASKPNRLNDAQRQQYYQAFVQAEADLHTAEAAVQQAQVAYDGARQAEITGIQAADRDVTVAQAALDKQRSGGAAEELAAARAAVESARAQLNQLTGAHRSGNVAAAQAGIDIAQAELEQLTNDPSASALARAEAGVARSAAALKVAQHELAQATLTAPFAATVARIDLRVGERSGQNGLIAIADLSSFHIDIPVDELDVAQIEPGQTVKIVLDALPGQDLTGTVTTIDPLATQTDKGTNTYTVVVTITATDPAVRPGMTAAAQIVTQHKEGIVLVPRRAVQSENGQSFVLIAKEGPFDRVTQTPANDKRPVTIGLTNSESVEITSGLNVGDKVLVKDVVSTIVPQNGP